MKISLRIKMGERFKQLFEDNGFPGLHVTKTAIEVVLTALCDDIYCLEALMSKYDLDLRNEGVYKVYTDLEKKEEGFTSIPVTKNPTSPKSTTTSVSLQNRFESLSEENLGNITSEEYADFMEVFKFSSPQLEDFVKEDEEVTLQDFGYDEILNMSCVDLENYMADSELVQIGNGLKVSYQDLRIYDILMKQ